MQLIDDVIVDAYAGPSSRKKQKPSPSPDTSSFIVSGHLPAERMTNLERQMGMVMKTLTTISADMSTFQKAVCNMDVLIRSVQDLQDSSFRSESRISASELESGHVSSVLSVSPGNRPRKSGRESSESTHGPREILSDSLSRPKPCDDDLRVARLVKAASDNGNRFRVRKTLLCCHVTYYSA